MNTGRFGGGWLLVRTLAIFGLLLIVCGALAGCTAPVPAPEATETAAERLGFYEFYSPM